MKNPMAPMPGHARSAGSLLHPCSSGRDAGPAFHMEETMKLQDYQDRAMETAVYPFRGGIVYLSLALAGEAGELANRVKKLVREKANVAVVPELDVDADLSMALRDELGDVLWYVAALAEELGWSLDVVAQANLDKLAGRQERGTILGDGEDR